MGVIYVKKQLTGNWFEADPSKLYGYIQPGTYFDTYSLREDIRIKSVERGRLIDSLELATRLGKEESYLKTLPEGIILNEDGEELTEEELRALFRYAFKR